MTTKPLYRTVTRCCACGGENLILTLSLGEQFLTNFVQDQASAPKAPLDVVRCATCNVLQLAHQVDPAILYGTDGSPYWYRCIGDETKLFALAGGKLYHDTAFNLLSRQGEILLPCMTDEGQVEWRLVLARQRMKSPAMRIGFFTGPDILVSPNHRWATFNRSRLRGTFAWGRVKSSDEMRVGDAIPVVLTMRRPEGSVDEDAIYGYDAGYFVGAYVAEGCRDGVGSVLTVHETKDEELIARVADFVGGRLQETVSVRHRPENHTKLIYLGGPVVNGILKKFVSGETAKVKHLSSDTWTQSIEFLRGIVDGWLDGDGHYEANQERWRFNVCVNPDLVDDMQLACAIVGYLMRWRRVNGANRQGRTDQLMGWVRKEPARARQHNRLGVLGATSVRETRILPQEHYVWEIDVGENGLFALGNGLVTHNSSMSGAMRDHLTSLMADVAKEASLGPRDIMVDIGSNDGWMAGSLDCTGLLRVGFEPGKRLAEESQKKGLYVFDSLFDGTTYEATFNRRAQAVTAIAMFYDVPRPLVFLQDLERILDYHGVAVIEMNTLWNMVTNTAFDIIGHEHVAYWSLTTLDPLLRQVGLRPFRVQHFPINGGSVRLWLCHQSDPRETEPSVGAQRLAEARDLTPELIMAFGIRASYEANRLRAWVEEENARGGRVYVWGASTRGRTIMQTAKIDGLIAGASEIHPDKIGKMIAGTTIPIIHEDQARQDATAFIVLPYSYREDVLVKEAEFVRRGGRLVFPLPELEVIG